MIDSPPSNSATGTGRPAQPQSEQHGRSHKIPGTPEFSPSSGSKRGDPQSGHSEGTPRNARTTRLTAIPTACWVRSQAMSVSVHVPDFACVSQLAKVQADSRELLIAPRRSLFEPPGSKSSKMISVHDRKSARLGGSSVQTAASWATLINSSRLSRRLTSGFPEVPDARPSIACRRSTSLSTAPPTSESVRSVLTGLRPSVRFPSPWRTRWPGRSWDRKFPHAQL